MLSAGVEIAVGSENDRSTGIDVTVRGSELTAIVRDAPLDHVLRAIGERAGLAMTLHGDLSSVVTESLVGVPLEEGIRRLARGHSVAVAYASQDSGLQVVARVWVVARSSLQGTVAAARRAPDLAPRGSDPSEPGPPPPAGQIGDGPALEGTVSPSARRSHEIQTLTEEARHGSEAAVSLLGDIIASEAEVSVRGQAVAALGRLKGSGIEQMLTAALDDDEGAVRVRAVRGLRGAGTETAMQSLTRVAIGDADPQVRLAALRALASLPGRTTLQGLARASSDPDDLVRETAIRGLSWWTTTRPPGAR